MSSDQDPRVLAFESRRRPVKHDNFAFRVVLEQAASFTLFCGATMIIAPYFEPLHFKWETFLSRLTAATILFTHWFSGHWAWGSLPWIAAAVAILAVDRRGDRAKARRLNKIIGIVVVAMIVFILTAIIALPGYEFTTKLG